jgi:hypothetical protein
MALVFGATMLLVGGGLGAVACSSSSNGGGSSSGSSSGGSGSSSGASGSSSGAGSSSGSSSGGAGDDGGGDGGTTTADCGSIPTLHQNPSGDLYCGFNPDGGAGGLDCVADAGTGWCCLGGKVGTGYAPQICGANAAECLANGAPDAAGGAGLPIPCNQISDCPANGFMGATACCLQGASAPATVAGCGYLKAKGGTAVVCEGTGGGAATSCAAGEVQICSSDTDCPTGTTCKPGKWKIFQIGFCQ